MKQILFISILFLFCSVLYAQDNLVITPTSLIKVYNYPHNYFYLKLKGKDIRKTENENIFLIDNQMVQVKALNEHKFIKNENPAISFIDFITTYVNWEKDYVEQTFSFNTNSKLEFLRSNKGRDIAFWTYNMPLGQPKVKTDKTVTTPVQKQLFVLTRVKNYMVGINCPLTETDNFDTIKSYLLANIDGIVESEKEINGKELYNQKND